VELIALAIMCAGVIDLGRSPVVIGSREAPRARAGEPATPAR